MADKYQNKYRTTSHRMPGWDYSGNGYYFITLVTQNRECVLGEVVDGEMTLSEFGKIVDVEWNKSFAIRAELNLDTYVVMPNHLHAIIILERGTNDTHGAHDTHVETHGRASLQCPSPSPIRKPKSISSFIAGFKSAINSKIDDYIDQNNLNIPKYDRNNHFFQSNYHDHIIRNETSYRHISEYIINNPSKWDGDSMNFRGTI